MKFKAIIALSLALLMLVILTTPALARPYRAYLVVETEATVPEPDGVTGQYTAQVTHNNQVKVTIVLKGALPNAHYWVMVQDRTYGGFAPAGEFYTNDKGQARSRGITNIAQGGESEEGYYSGFHQMSIIVSFGNGTLTELHFSADLQDVYFK